VMLLKNWQAKEICLGLVRAHRNEYRRLLRRRSGGNSKVGGSACFAKGEQDTIGAVVLHLICFPAMLWHLGLVVAADGLGRAWHLEAGLAGRGSAHQLRARIERDVVRKTGVDRGSWPDDRGCRCGVIAPAAWQHQKRESDQATYKNEHTAVAFHRGHPSEARIGPLHTISQADFLAHFSLL
jgi:hypothetical protein